MLSLLYHPGPHQLGPQGVQKVCERGGKSGGVRAHRVPAYDLMMRPPVVLLNGRGRKCMMPRFPAAEKKPNLLSRYKKDSTNSRTPWCKALNHGGRASLEKDGGKEEGNE